MLLALCEGNPTLLTSAFLSQRANTVSFDFFLWCQYPRQSVEWTVELLVISDTVTLTWCPYNEWWMSDQWFTINITRLSAMQYNWTVLEQDRRTVLWNEKALNSWTCIKLFYTLIDWLINSNIVFHSEKPSHIEIEWCIYASMNCIIIGSHFPHSIFKLIWRLFCVHLIVLMAACIWGLCCPAANKIPTQHRKSIERGKSMAD